MRAKGAWDKPYTFTYGVSPENIANQPPSYDMINFDIFDGRIVEDDITDIVVEEQETATKLKAEDMGVGAYTGDEDEDLKENSEDRLYIKNGSKDVAVRM